MKSRSLLIFVLVVSLAVVPSLQIALGASTSSSSSSSSTSTSTVPKTPYSERVDIYTAGANDYWTVTLSPVNATRPDLVAAESVSGVTAYEASAVQWSTASQASPLFGPQGYNVAQLPFAPYSGIFLNVTATSLSAAQSAASDFDSLFGASFVQIGSGGGNFTFYSPADFGIAGASIFSTVPTVKGGFATLVNESALAGSPTPTAVLTGVRSGSSFTHAVRFGSTETGAIGTNNSLLVENALFLTHDTMTSSKDATSSRLVVHALDGLVKSPDNATVSNHVANFSATYSLSVPAGTTFRPNVTVIANPPVLTGTRTVNSGSVTTGGLISVTLNFQNTAVNGTLQNVVVNDSWWKAYPSLFALNAGNASFTIPSIAPLQNVSRAYVLKVLSSSSQDLVVPAASASYSYVAGALNVNATTNTNQLEIRLNDAGPALELQAQSDVHTGSALGKAGSYVVTVVNTGNAPALNLQVLNYTNPTLVPGGNWTVKTPLAVNSIEDRNLTQTFTLGWTAPDGSKGTLVSNPIRVVLSHTNVLLPAVSFKLTATSTATGLARGAINATWTLTNKGAAIAGNVSVAQAFPSGMTCKRVVSGNGTCGASGFSLQTSSLAIQGSMTGTVLLAFSNDNYLVSGANVTVTQGTLILTSQGSSLPVAAGLVVKKSFSPSELFAGDASTATVSVGNSGSLPVYNVSLSTSADSFDTVSGTLNKQYAVLAPGATDSLNYTAKMIVPGNHTSSSTSLSLIFGGYGVSYPVSSGSALVFKPVEVTASITSTPREGDHFAFPVVVQNLSPVNVTDVSFSFQLPPGLTVVSYPSGFQVSGKTVTLTVASLSAGGTTNSSLTLKADFDGTFTLGSPAMKFVYLGTTVPGVVSASPISIGVDALTRYEIPVAIAVLVVLGVAVYMHRKLAVPAK